MKKSNTHAKNGAILVGLVNCTTNVVLQLDEMGKNPDLKFDFWRMTVATFKGAAIGGIGGYALGLYMDYQNSQVQPINTNPTLKDIAEEASLDEKDPLYLEYQRQSQVLCNKIYKHYGSRLKSRPFYYGSSVKGTALKGSHDLDIALQFWYDSFGSLGEIYDDLWLLLNSFKKEGLIWSIRLQNNSIGVFLNVYGEKLKIDFVPVQVTKKKSSSGYLRVNRQSLFSDKSTIKKTDVKLLTSVRFTPGEKEVIVLLKKWKKENGIPISSYLLEQLVCRTYHEVPGLRNWSISKRIKGIARFISENFYSIRMTSPENSNNNLTDLDCDQKTEIVNAFNRLYRQYEYQPNSIIEIFQ